MTTHADVSELSNPDAWPGSVDQVEEGQDYTRTVTAEDGTEHDVTVTVTEIRRHEDGSLAGISYSYSTP